MTTDMTADASLSGTFKIGGDLKVNRLGFGAMRITGPGIWGEPPDRDEALRVLRKLPELNVNFVDTADSYGPEVSEKLIRESTAPVLLVPAGVSSQSARTATPARPAASVVM